LIAANAVDEFHFLHEPGSYRQRRENLRRGLFLNITSSRFENLSLRYVWESLRARQL